MKKLTFTCYLLIVAGFGFLRAQAINHPTVEKLKVAYKAVSTGTTNTGKPDIQVIPRAFITLKTTSNISKIYLKIVDQNTNSVIYQVNYNLNSSDVTNAQGLKLYTRDNLLVQICDPVNVSLDTYSYQVITEDGQGNQSIAYSAIL